MADTTTTNLGLTKPEDQASEDNWGPKLNTDMDIIDAAIISHNYAENAASHSGLNFAYKAGRVRYGTTVSTTAAGSVTLADDDTSYIEVDPSDGTVSDNVTGFTAGSIPIFEVVTASGAITTVTDKRAFLSRDNVRGICFSINNVDLATTQSVAITAPCALKVTGGKLEVGTAPTGASLICDIHKNGTTLWTTQGNRPTITASGTSASITAPDVTSIAQGDRLLLMIDQVGSTVKGKDLSLTLYCEVA